MHGRAGQRADVRLEHRGHVERVVRELQHLRARRPVRSRRPRRRPPRAARTAADGRRVAAEVHPDEGLGHPRREPGAGHRRDQPLLAVQRAGERGRPRCPRTRRPTRRASRGSPSTEASVLEDGVLHAAAGAEERDPLARARRSERPATAASSAYGEPGTSQTPSYAVTSKPESVGTHSVSDRQHRAQRVELEVAAVAAVVAEQRDGHASLTTHLTDPASRAPRPRSPGRAW